MVLPSVPFNNWIQNRQMWNITMQRSQSGPFNVNICQNRWDIWLVNIRILFEQKRCKNRRRAPSTLLSKIVEIDGKHDNAIIAISSLQELGPKQTYAKLHNADRCEMSTMQRSQSGPFNNCHNGQLRWETWQWKNCLDAASDRVGAATIHLSRGSTTTAILKHTIEMAYSDSRITMM